MIYPSLDALLKKVDCKFALVVFAAKRAREITNGDSSLIKSESHKPVTVALEEIAQGKIVSRRLRRASI